MKIYDINGSVILDIEVDDSSYRFKEVMSENRYYISFALDYPIDLPLFCWTTFKGEKYFLIEEENFTKLNTENHEYRLVMDTYVAYLKTQKYEFFTVDRSGSVEVVNSDMEIEFHLIATPLIFIQLMVDNMNQKDRERGWTVGECIDSAEMLIDVNDMTCYDVLNMLAETFKTEGEVEGKTIHLRKIEKMPDNPIPLSYGKGNGLLPGISRETFKGRIGALRVKTTERNIDRSLYGFKTLKMPRNYVLEYEGIKYITDSTGSRIYRETPLYNTPVIPEETIDLTKFYPSRVGTVSHVIAVDPANDLYDFIDSSIPADLDYSQHRIDGEEAIVIFQTGQLTGIEIPLEQTDTELTGYVHSERRFKLVPTTEYGVTYPHASIIPAVGDKYAVFNIGMPQSYINDAEQKVMGEAVKFLYENEDPKFTYRATLDGIYAKQKWGEIGGRLNIGYFVRLSDPQYLSEPVDIRITAIKEYVNRPMSPEITLSNSVSGKSFMSKINELPNTEQTIKRNTGDAVRFSKRRWHDTVEMSKYLENSMLNFSGAINPISVHAMMAYLGDESLQFRWVDSKTNPVAIDHAFTYDTDTKTFSSPAGIIQHMTLGIDTMAPSHAASAYKFWDIAAFAPISVEDRPALWLYLKCEKSGTNGAFVLSETSIGMNDVTGYYHFLTGFLNSEFDGDRSFMTLYGFSEWTPGQMRVDKIASTDGTQYWDMLNKAFFLGNQNANISFDSSVGSLVLKGTFVQSQSGATSPIGVNRGAYASATTYYKGDEVTSGGSTYQYINNTAVKGITPPNATYWAVVAQKGDTGGKGDTGATGSPGATGSDGKNGRIFSYMGEYSSSKTYTGDLKIAQIVKSGSQYWYTADTAGDFSGVTPSPQYQDKWISYGASFDSIATGLLFAEKALIAGFNFYNDRIESVQKINGVPKVKLDGNTGEITIQSESNTGRLSISNGVLYWYGLDGSAIMSFSLYRDAEGGVLDRPSIVLKNLPAITKQGAPIGTLYKDGNGFVKILQ